jgi:hypothetical protein
MTRTGHQRRVAQRVEQVVDGAQLPQDAELLLYNALQVFTTQRADFVFRSRACSQSGFELGLLFDREWTRTTASRAVFQAGQALVVETADPILNLSPTELGLRRHFVGRESRQSPANDPQSLSPRSILRFGDQTVQLTLRTPQFDAHREPPCNDRKLQFAALCPDFVDSASSRAQFLLGKRISTRWPLPNGATWWAEEGSNIAIQDERYLNNCFAYIFKQRATPAIRGVPAPE